MSHMDFGQQIAVQPAILECGEVGLCAQLGRQRSGDGAGSCREQLLRADKVAGDQQVGRIRIQLVGTAEPRGEAALPAVGAEVHRDHVKLAVLRILARTKIDHLAETEFQRGEEQFVADGKTFLGLVDGAARQFGAQVGLFAAAALGHERLGELSRGQRAFGVQQAVAEEFGVGWGQ